MASPQKEDGYTAIANELMEALAKVNIGYGNAQILYAVLRKTYGWSKKEDKISISQFEEITGLSRRMVIYCVQNLEAKKMLIVKRKRGRGNINEINEISFNKNYEEWVVQEKSKQYQKALNNKKIRYLKSKNKVVQETGGSARTRKGVVQEHIKDPQFVAPTKETITKTIITKTKGIDFTKDMLQLFEQEFKRYWEDYDPRGQKNKQYAKKRFIALCKTGGLPEFDKGYIGYANYLKDKRINEGFDQKPKYFSTLISDYKEYIGFEYKPPK